MIMMIGRIFRAALRHRGLVTVVLLAGLLVNLFVVGWTDPPDPTQHGDLPLAARCQGGGPGCATQPMIPPPVGGLPHFDLPPAPVFGALVLVEPTIRPAMRGTAPATLDPPPIADAA
jgi:hypothetical protein